jgi:regulator of replication initiation timing
MNTDELIQMLRDAENNTELDCEIRELRPVLSQAADAIEALTAENKRLKTENEKFRKGDKL